VVSSFATYGLKTVRAFVMKEKKLSRRRENLKERKKQTECTAMSGSGGFVKQPDRWSESSNGCFHRSKDNRKNMKMLVQFILGGLALYAGYCLLLFLFQRTILFPRFQIPAATQTETNLPGLEKMWLETTMGNVEAWYLPPKSESKSRPAPAVIFAHGNGEIIDFWPKELAQLTTLGLGVLLVEYPGYGRSTGSPSQKSITEAFVAAYDRLVERGDVDSSRIVFFGRSLGGGVVCALAAKRPSAALILFSTFTSVRDFAIRFLVPGFLVRDPFDSLQFLRSYAGPVLVIHGRNDDVVPYDHGVRLYRVVQNGKFVSYDCRHNDCPPAWSIFWNEVHTFLINSGIVPNRP
jgi:pimeloyl-ACP methyl ester carboxylesterase